MEQDKIMSYIEAEIESRAREMAVKMVEEMQRPSLPSDVAPNGELITPFVFGGTKYLTSKQVEQLLGIQYPALWKMNKDKRLTYRKVGGRLLYDYDEVHRFFTNR